MSSTISASTSASSPSSTSPSSPPDNSSPASNSLYLFTFLTTLLLLLAVSCGIVLRSFILRRRFRRRVEAAIAAGVLLPEQVDALRRRGPQIGDKPKMWEVYIDGRHKEGYEPSSSYADQQRIDDDWSNIMPVSATIIPGARAVAPVPVPAPVPPPQQYSARPLNPRRNLWWLRGPDTNPTPLLPVSAPPPPPPVVPDPSINNGPNDDKLQLTVLIAMPNANARQYHPGSGLTAGSSESTKGKEAHSDSHDEDEDEEEEEIPEVVFGVTEVQWDAGADWKPEEGKSDGKDSESAS